jgi:ABC-type lipopolysaccharide export system ATPase subunit
MTMLSLENICDWGFLRPNGAGETATMRTIFGLVRERRRRIARRETHGADLHLANGSSRSPCGGFVGRIR